MATLRSGVFQPAAAVSAGDIVRVEAPAVGTGRASTFLGEEVAAVGSGPALKDAKIVVAGGRGLGAADNWRFIEEIARVLGAAVGCSRPVADSGWVPTACQVGLSGTCVIAGPLHRRRHFRAPCSILPASAPRRPWSRSTSIPPRTSSRAPTYGVVGDYREVLPAFAQRVKELRS